MKNIIVSIAAAVLAAALFTGVRAGGVSTGAQYWDTIDFRGAATDAAQVTQLLERFLAECPAPDSAAVAACAKAGAASQESALAMSQAVENCLYSAGTPESDELYASFVRAMLSTHAYPDSTRLQWMLEVTAKNAPGTAAADFPLEFADGTQGRLSDTRGLPLLLFFYDPECDHCREVAARIAGLPLAGRLVAENRIRVLAVCPDAPDGWRTNSTWLPDGWLCATDNSAIDEDELYVFDSYPALYVLDNEGYVIAKNANEERIRALLENF